MPLNLPKTQTSYSTETTDPVVKALIDTIANRRKKTPDFTGNFASAVFICDQKSFKPQFGASRGRNAHSELVAISDCIRDAVNTQNWPFAGVQLAQNQSGEYIFKKKDIEENSKLITALQNTKIVLFTERFPCNYTTNMQCKKAPDNGGCIPYLTELSAFVISINVLSPFTHNVDTKVFTDMLKIAPALQTTSLITNSNTQDQRNAPIAATATTPKSTPTKPLQHNQQPLLPSTMISSPLIHANTPTTQPTFLSFVSQAMSLQRCQKLWKALIQQLPISARIKKDSISAATQENHRMIVEGSQEDVKVAEQIEKEKCPPLSSHRESSSLPFFHNPPQCFNFMGKNFFNPSLGLRSSANPSNSPPIVLERASENFYQNLLQQIQELSSVCITKEQLNAIPVQYKLTIRGSSQELEKVQIFINQQFSDTSANPTTDKQFKC